MLEFPAVGRRNNSSGALENAGTNGNYWSSTQNDSNNAYNMYFNSSNVNTDWNNRRNGFSVRCVRREFTTLILTQKLIDITGSTEACRRLASSFVNVCYISVAVLEFPAVGYRNNSDGSLNNPGTNGRYWSSEQNSSTNAYRMNFNSSSVNTDNNNKTNGYSVRCVRQRIYDPDF